MSVGTLMRPTDRSATEKSENHQLRNNGSFERQIIFLFFVNWGVKCLLWHAIKIFGADEYKLYDDSEIGNVLLDNNLDANSLFHSESVKWQLTGAMLGTIIFFILLGVKVQSIKFKMRESARSDSCFSAIVNTGTRDELLDTKVWSDRH